MQERETFKNHTVYSLSDVAMSIHKVIERTYTRPYYIKAEILKLNYYPYSGHCYPELVEREGNTIKTEMRAVIWSANFQDINRRFVQFTGEPLPERRKPGEPTPERKNPGEPPSERRKPGGPPPEAGSPCSWDRSFPPSARWTPCTWSGRRAAPFFPPIPPRRRWKRTAALEKH